MVIVVLQTAAYYKGNHSNSFHSSLNIHLELQPHVQPRYVQACNGQLEQFFGYIISSVYHAIAIGFLPSSLSFQCVFVYICTQTYDFYTSTLQPASCNITRDHSL